MEAGMMPPELSCKSSFGAEGVVSKPGLSVAPSDSNSENVMSSGGVYGFKSGRREGIST